MDTQTVKRKKDTGNKAESRYSLEEQKPQLIWEINKVKIQSQK